MRGDLWLQLLVAAAAIGVLAFVIRSWPVIDEVGIMLKDVEATKQTP